MDLEKIDIVMAADDNYAPWLGILIMSIIRKSHHQPLHFHIIGNDISALNRQKITSLSNRDDIEFHWYQPENKNYNGFPLKRYGIATYYRLSMASILPETLKKIVYLDCDMLAVDDIAKLFNILDGSAVLAAVEDISAPRTEIGFEQHEYFNAGTLVIDMKRWREGGYEEKLLDLMKKRGDELKYLDQDALNIVFRNAWQRLPLEWNFQPGLWRRVEKGQFNLSGYTEREHRESLCKPAIVHFLARRKPWIYGCIHPLKTIYLDYLKQSPWAELYPRPNSVSDVLSYYSGLDKLYKQQKRWNNIKKYL